MDEKDARSILGLHRPEENELEDARFADAQRQAEADPTLAKWWAEEKDLDQLIAVKLGCTPVPADLKERLRSPGEVPTVARVTWQRPLLLAAAACLVALAVLFSVWRSPFQPAVSLNDYRDEMVGFVKVTPALELETSDLSRVKTFLQKRHAPFAFEIPQKLQDLQPVGCRTLRFRGHDVALICFRRENGKLAHLFVTDPAALPSLPKRDKPTYAADGEWMTAAWAQGEQAYLVMVQGDQAQLKKFVETS